MHDPMDAKMALITIRGMRAQVDLLSRYLENHEMAKAVALLFTIRELSEKSALWAAAHIDTDALIETVGPVLDQVRRDFEEIVGPAHQVDVEELLAHFEEEAS